MWKLLKEVMPLLTGLPILLLGGCGTLIPSLSSVAATDAFGPVPVYTKAPCPMQRQWSAHNSTVETVRTGKVVIYKPPCDIDPKPALKPVPSTTS